MNDNKIAILTDSGSDVPQEIKEKYNVKVIPLKIIFNDGEYIDKVTITAEEVYQRMDKEIPKTSLPDGETIKEMFDGIKAEGYEKVLAITISSGLSGTNNMVRVVAEQYDGLDIFVLDTKNIGIASGFTVAEAALQVDRGVDWETLKVNLTEGIEKAKVFFYVPTLEYLQKGGRIGLVQSVVGSMMNLKPIITCNEEGIYHTVAKVRGKTKSIKKTIDLVEDFAKGSEKYNLAIAYGGETAREEAEDIREEMKIKLPNYEHFFYDQISPALGVHTGPGLIGIGVQILD
ncbi:DegV family protein [Alkalibacterium sp. 20]|uniref:DegV family protein n=1 Tax=Alkalibacterium sp. 20 TaxID=1798803 RepID=UPI00090018C4|nr:DegV family protein [Alkalibacterium sp. 20]OJF95196.1 fatty acid-binding protein DegV [Alkalibacterium sp. 20]